MIEGVGIALGGFALEVYVSGDPVSRRVPIKRLRAASALLADAPVRVQSAAPAGGHAVLARFSDGVETLIDLTPLVAPREERGRADAVVRNAANVLTMAEPADHPLGAISDGAVAMRHGRVVWVGKAAELASAVTLEPDALVIDAGGGLVTPGLVDAHTHPVFAGRRAHEFAARARGETYAEIQARGGGILSTVRATRAASAVELCVAARARMRRMLAHGVTSCEGKSGYALTLEGERALLAVLAEVSASQPIDIAPTLLAHVPPEDCTGPRERTAYVEAFAHRLVPEVARAGLAESCDVYCDAGAFTLAESRTILTAARAAGLATRMHAEQFTRTGAAELAAQLGARSADHLEQIDEAGIVTMARAGVTATLLPGAALTLRLPWPPARRLIEAGVRVALGTDCNPGSSMTESLPLMMSLACMQMGMTVEEAWLGVTAHAARAIGHMDAGRLVPGARADVCVFRCDDPAYVPYHYGEDHLRCVIKNGQVVHG
jgi:imidazolonepropionase